MKDRPNTAETRKRRKWPVVLGFLMLLVIVATYAIGDHPKAASAAQVEPFKRALDAEPNLKYKSYRGPDDGLIVTGTLEDRSFYIAVPKDWNHQSIVFANGYSMPGSTTNTKMDWKALEPNRKGGLRALYMQGYLVAQSAYDKSGFAVESAVRNTLRLNQLVKHLGASPVYGLGASMGGGVVVDMIEQQPRPFESALAMCGVVGSWNDVFGQVMDMRAVYNYFAKDTPYAMPGEKALDRDILNPIPPYGFGFTEPLWGGLQLKRIIRPVQALFHAAAKDPNGKEAAMIRHISEAANVPADAASFSWQLFTVGFGMKDMYATFGGSPYDNTHKVYRAASLSEEENVRMNREIQRVSSNPAAIAYGQRWNATGHFSTPLVTLHNQVDALVYREQEDILKSAAEKAGSMALLHQITVPALVEQEHGQVPGGHTHCGFTTDQIVNAFHEAQAFGRQVDAASAAH